MAQPPTLVELHTAAGEALMDVYAAGKAWVTHPHGCLAFYASARVVQENAGPQILTEKTFESQDGDTRNLSAHARLEGETKKSETEAAWNRYLLAVVQLENAIMAVLGRVSPGWKVCVDTTVQMSCHDTYGKKGVTLRQLKMGFGFSRVGKPETGGAMRSPEGLNPESGWDLERQRLRLLETLDGPDLGQAPWHVFVPGDVRSQTNTFLRSRPHYARDAQEALLRCAVLEWPDLLETTAHNTITVAQSYAGASPLDYTPA